MIRLLPNLGGEEGPGWRNLRSEPSVRAQAQLWALLFPADAQDLYDEEPVVWPEALGERPAEAAWPWLGADGIVPWIATDDAVADRFVAGRRLVGPAPDVVRAVHD
ncbi:MAG: hypothetical protein HKP30_10615, partial [Myxococcales bacterium]|nr:hypothetical protein [Myxococcales bacterium]